jgi:hypothetical protein
MESGGLPSNYQRARTTTDFSWTASGRTTRSARYARQILTAVTTPFVRLPNA